MAILAVAELFGFLFFCCFTESTDLELFLWPDAVVGQGFPVGQFSRQGTSGLDSSDVTLHGREALGGAGGAAQRPTV